MPSTGKSRVRFSWARYEAKYRRPYCAVVCEALPTAPPWIAVLVIRATSGEDTVVFDALREADGNEAARLWRVRIERCVRYMLAQLPEDDVTPHVWASLAGRPRLHPEDTRTARR